MNLKSPEDYLKNLELQNVKISIASVNDISGILSVQKENLLLPTTKISEKTLEKIGFLIHKVSAEELEKLILDKENTLVLVAKESNEIKGYVLAYDLNLWKKLKPQWEQTIRIYENKKEIFKDKNILYLRHIARKRKAKGIGSKLMSILIYEARSRAYHAIICEILKKPITNQISMDFHRRFGFEEIGNVKENENLIWGLFLKML